MTGKEFLYHVVLAWNRLRKPTTISFVEKVAIDIVDKYKYEDIAKLSSNENPEMLPIEARLELAELLMLVLKGEAYNYQK